MNTLDDGFGNRWEKCDHHDCALEIVRPGKVQCVRCDYTDEPSLSEDAKRLNWLHSELKVTIADALNWGTIPQDPISFRAALDKAMAEKT